MHTSLTLQLRYGLIFWGLLLCGGWFYMQGVSNRFILDDEPNLQVLATTVDDWDERIDFITDSGANLLGRPVSLLSFVLQDYQWPQAAGFKYVNICIHLLIASLLFWLSLLLSVVLKLSTTRAYGLALFTTALWLFSPIQVSTVLYVVQRMAQLSVLFTVLGVLSYVQGRLLLDNGRLWAGYSLASVGLVIGGLLALLSKENGVLILLYVLALELSLFSHFTPAPYWYWWRRLFIYMPLLIIFSYFSFFYDIQSAYEIRDYSLSERLLTEPRILLEYIQKVFLPSPRAFGLFHDDYVFSRGLFNPISTLPSLLLIIASLIAALWWRRRYPLWSFALLWFFAGHALESTAIGLVLYFEHRNYLAIFGLLFAAVYSFMQLIQHPSLSTLLRRTAQAVGVFWLALVIWVSFSEIRLWHTPNTQALYWAQQHPYSRFAQSEAAVTLLNLDKPEAAIEIYKKMIERFPNDAANYVFWLNISCHYPHIAPPDFDVMRQHFREQAREEYGLLSGLGALHETLQNTSLCPGVMRTRIEALFIALTENPHFTTTSRGMIYLYYGQIMMDAQQYAQAIPLIEKAIASGIPRSSTAKLIKLGLLLQTKQYQAALAYIKQLRAEFNLVENRLHKAHLEALESLANQLLLIHAEEASGNAP